MPDVDGPRLMTNEEYDETMALVDHVFNNQPGGFQRVNPHSYNPDAPEHHAVVRVDGKVVSHVGCTPQHLVVGSDAPVECWGITGVATHPRHRGNGYMSALMNFWAERMGESDVPLANLFGDRVRYQRFGYEIAGRQCSFSISERSMPDTDVSEDTIRQYTGDREDLALIRRFHERDTLRVRRNPDNHRAFFEREDLETLIYEDSGTVAYIGFNRSGAGKNLIEVGGDADGIHTLLAYLFETYDTESIPTFRGSNSSGGVSLSVHPRHPLTQLFDRISTTCELVPHQMLRIADLPATLKAFEGQLRSNRRIRSVGEERVTLGLIDRPKSVKIAVVDNDLSVTSVKAAPDLRLTRLEMTRLLFGAPHLPSALLEQHPILEAILPLEYYIPSLDQV